MPRIKSYHHSNNHKKPQTITHTHTHRWWLYIHYILYSFILQIAVVIHDDLSFQTPRKHKVAWSTCAFIPLPWFISQHPPVTTSRTSKMSPCWAAQPPSTQCKNLPQAETLNSFQTQAYSLIYTKRSCSILVCHCEHSWVRASTGASSDSHLYCMCKREVLHTQPRSNIRDHQGTFDQLVLWILESLAYDHLNTQIVRTVRRCWKNCLPWVRDLGRRPQRRLCSSPLRQRPTRQE